MNASAPPLTLNDLLRLSDIAPGSVLVFRHRPSEPKFNKIFDWLVAERPALFDCYQSTHGPRTEAALANAQYLASFIRHKPGTALFVGFYEITSKRRISMEDYAERLDHKELLRLGMTGIRHGDADDSLLEFTLARTPWHHEWRGRMIVRWPGLERSWYRWGHRNEFGIEAIAPESLLIPPIGPWDTLAVEWRELALLPSSWAAQMSQWRGIYLILDQSDGKQYVGSAYGVENILQRWRNYGQTGHGGNVLLRQRDPANFRFSILQRVSPDLPDSDVIRIEGTWKDRLRTRAPFGLNEN